MKVKGVDKFEYKYEELYSSIKNTENMLNILGREGWEVIELIKPKSNTEPYKAWFKRRIIEIEV